MTPCCLILQWLFATPWLLDLASTSTPQYSVVEESPLGTTIIPDLRALLPPSQTNYKPSTSTGSTLFSMESSSNIPQLVVANQIDLESLCPLYQLCCATTKCSIPLTIVFTSTSIIPPNTAITINIEVIDRNDNFPAFASPRQTVSIPEDLPVDSLIYLEPASDPDFSSAHQISHYSWSGPAATLFHLASASSDRTTPPSPQLRLASPLDYELVSSRLFSGQLEACDLAMQCTKQTVSIHVTDVNDNLPQFTQQVYHKEIQENFPINQQVLQLTAVDKDSPAFAKVRYGIANSDANVRATFLVTENTGSVKLVRGLSARVRSMYTFTVFALDASSSRHSGGSEKWQSTARVNISVVDLNDHAPEIKVLGGEDRSLSLLENSVAGQLLMNLEVSDGDLGVNAQVECDLVGVQQGVDFRLNRFSSGSISAGSPVLYSLLSGRTFDYEAEQSLEVEVSCNDNGRPSMRSSRKFRVQIQDVNEFAPQCNQSQYEIRVRENLDGNTELLRVGGWDGDALSQLTFQIVGPANIYVSMRPDGRLMTDTGAIMDREVMDRLDMKVSVRDVGGKSGDCSVVVWVEDENDNSPRFIEAQGMEQGLLVMENSPAMTPVRGLVMAVDDDKSPSNSRIRYEVARGTDILQIRGDGQTGELVSLMPLDREIGANYTVEIRAVDNGSPPRFTLMNITLRVGDINDNPPHWIQPKVSSLEEEAHVNITRPSTQGCFITELQAEDKDEGDNSKVSYQLLSSNSMFYVNETSSWLVAMGYLPEGSWSVLLRAVDHGYPALHSDLRLRVHVSYRSIGGYGGSSPVILLLVVVTGGVSVVLIVAIVCVRRRWPHLDHPPSTGLSAAATVDAGDDYGKKVADYKHESPLLAAYELQSSTLPLASYYQHPLHHHHHHQGNSNSTSDIVTPSYFLGGGPTDSYPYYHQHQQDNGKLDGTSFASLRPSSPHQSIHGGSGTWTGRCLAINPQSPAAPNNTMVVPGYYNLHDNDSADSGRGGSEDGIGASLSSSSCNYGNISSAYQTLLGQYATFDPNANNSRQCSTTLPFHTNQATLTSRLLMTANTNHDSMQHRQSLLRCYAMMPSNTNPNTTSNQPASIAGCYIVPEDCPVSTSTSDNYSNYQHKSPSEPDTRSNISYSDDPTNQLHLTTFKLPITSSIIISTTTSSSLLNPCNQNDK